MRKSATVGALFVAMSLWGLNLGYPMQYLQHVRWTLFGYIIPVYYLLTVVFIAGASVLVLAGKRNWTKWEMLWWALPLICIPGILHSDDPIWSARQWLSWMVRGLIPGGILFAAASSCRKQSFAMLLWLVYPIILAASLLGLVELYCGHSPLYADAVTPIVQTAQPGNPFYRPIDPFVNNSLVLSQRPRGTQGNRIPYAAMILPFLPLAIWALKYKRRFSWAHALAVGILFSILLLAQVRAVWFGIVAVMVLMPAMGLQRDSREGARIAAGTLLCLFVILFWPKSHASIELWGRLQSFKLTENSIHARLEALQTAGVLRDRWFLGVGFGRFPTACMPYYHGAHPWEGTPDNQYLRWAIENGVPSFILMLVFFAGLIRAGWEKIRLMKDNIEAEFYKSLLVGWLGIAATFLFFDGFYWGACNMTFWSFFGLFATCLNSEPYEVDDRGRD